MIRFACILAAAILTAPAMCRGETVHVIVCGIGGEPEYEEKFEDWGQRLRTILLSYSGDDACGVQLYTESGADGAQPSTLESLRAGFAELAQRVGPETDVFVYLIGHGSHRAGVSKLNLPGPDLSAEELKAWLDALPVERCAVIQAASASAGFINVLSGPGRIVCTATKDVEERNATAFMGAFVEALEDDSADLDRDGRISVLEACTQASVLTAAGYTSQGLIATEHALLDDNGDGLGMRLPIDAEPAEEGKAADGALARTVYLKDYAFPSHVPGELIDAYQRALDAVEALKARKAELSEADYYAQLEALLLEAARAHRTLRESAR